MCKICDITNEGIEQVPASPFDENDFNRITNGVWIGEFTVDNLPVPAYIKTADFLKSAVSLGFAEYDKVDELLKADILDNIYLFSGAKTYQQVRTLTTLLADPELKNNFYKFKDAANPILHDYNVAYLKTEYYTAKGSSRMAAFWDRIGQESDVLPLLKYLTVGDARVRPTHRALDEIIRPVNDSFWNNYFPPNGWRCRCTVEQLADGNVTDLTGFVKPNDVPPEFMMNSGKDGYIFKEKGEGKHPYFDVAFGDKELAKKNFNLPIISHGQAK